MRIRKTPAARRHVPATTTATSSLPASILQRPRTRIASDHHRRSPAPPACPKATGPTHMIAPQHARWPTAARRLAKSVAPLGSERRIPSGNGYVRQRWPTGRCGQQSSAWMQNSSSASGTVVTQRVPTARSFSQAMTSRRGRPHRLGHDIGIEVDQPWRPGGRPVTNPL